jgi:hypothetical protein
MQILKEIFFPDFIGRVISDLVSSFDRFPTQPSRHFLSLSLALIQVFRVITSVSGLRARVEKSGDLGEQFHTVPS